MLQLYSESMNFGICLDLKIIKQRFGAKLQDLTRSANFKSLPSKVQ